jgi:hypothetical protein
VLYNPKTFFTHAALLDQACAHCPIFPTAASRRSLGRVSVPMWLIILSDQLPIIALVGLYPTNKLIRRRLLLRRLAPLTLRFHAVLAAVSRRYPPPQDRCLRVTHPSATARNRSPEPCDLHVLSMPPAFALSQDQTLRFIPAPRLPKAPKQTDPITHSRSTQFAPRKSNPKRRNASKRYINNALNLSKPQAHNPKPTHYPPPPSLRMKSQGRHQRIPS